MTGTTISRSRRNRRQAIVLALVVALAVLSLLVVYTQRIVELSDSWSLSDFAAYYASVRHFWAGESIYAPARFDDLGKPPQDAQPTGETMHPDLSPPPLTLYLAPLGMWNYPTARTIWSTFSLLRGIAAAGLIGASIGGTEDRPTRILFLEIVLLAYFPSLGTIATAQGSFVLLLLASVVWLAARKGRDAAAGIALALALTIKPYAALLVLFFLLRRRWRLLLWCAAACLLVVVATLLAFGAQAYRDYVAVLQSITWYGKISDASLLGFLTRIFGRPDTAPLLSMPRLAGALYYAGVVLGVLAVSWLSCLAGASRRHRCWTWGLG
jgi:hypothetical protein